MSDAIRTYPRLPVDPLLGYARRRFAAGHDRLDRTRSNGDGQISITELAELLNVPGRTMRGWCQRGTVPLHAADRIACKALRVHPSLIWPGYFDLVRYPTPASARNGRALT